MLKIIVSDGEGKQNSIDIIDDNLLFFVKSFDNHMDKELLKNKVRYLYNKWLNQKAKEIFIPKINKYSKIIGVCPPKRIILKSLKNRWGSVTK